MSLWNLRSVDLTPSIVYFHGFHLAAANGQAAKMADGWARVRQGEPMDEVRQLAVGPRPEEPMP